MGSPFSKKKGGEPSILLPANIDFSDLASFEAASWAVDPGLSAFGQTVQQTTERVFRSLAADGQSKAALPFEALGAVARSTLEVNQAVVRTILDSREDIWKNKDLLDLVSDYFENSLGSFNFCTALNKCVRRAKEGHSRILLAVSYFDEESQLEASCFERTLGQLERFKEAGDPFTDEFMALLDSVYGQQLKMLKSLETFRNRVDRKLRSSKTWMRITNVIYVAAFVSTIIVSVVAVALAAPPVVTAVAAGLAAPIGSLGKWCSTLWKNYRKELKQQKELLTLATGFMKITIADIQTIKILVGRLEIEVESLVANADLADREGAVALTIGEIRKKLDVFMELVESLGEHADQGSQYIQKARAIILQRITGQSSN
ncbi:hypothetical protein MLD38_028637 [Melastoma candidum]|uniref:Uncharacterized protein n=1 Tax=Melastoma candidum TaxID=119954 RepID=A0ACB9N3U3_9MYRT|nr:hypothetical protein MLD38_028637 [Melastoma candidum]